MNKPRNPVKIGEIFERLTVVEELGERTKRGRKIVICKCVCGTALKVEAGNLRSGHTRSCGCLVSQNLSDLRKKAPGEVTYNTLEGSYKKSAILRNITWDLSKEEFRSIIKQNCFWCNDEPILKSVYFKNNNTLKSSYKVNYDNVRVQSESWVKINGVDRKDNTKGYHINNVVACCKVCNRIKSAYTEEFFINHIAKIARMHVQKELNEKESNHS